MDLVFVKVGEQKQNIVLKVNMGFLYALKCVSYTLCLNIIFRHGQTLKKK